MLLKNFNVLVVDDVVLMCSFLYNAVNKVHGCRAHKAFDYKAAADILEHEPIDLLITDIELGSKSGLDLLMKIRTNAFTATAHDIPIIVFSGNSYRELLQKCISFDANDFLVKPVTYAHLKEKIYYHLEHEKTIQPPSYYIELMRGVKKPERVNAERARQSSISTARAIKRRAAATEDILAEYEEKLENLDRLEFLFWPDKVTTGYFQIDRRLKNLVHTVSFFYQACINDYKPVMKETERRRACSAAEALIHIATRTRRAEQYPNNEFWNELVVRLDELRPLLAELRAIDLRNTYEVIELLIKLASWWVDTCKSPLVNEVDEQNETENM